MALELAVCDDGLARRVGRVLIGFEIASGSGSRCQIQRDNSGRCNGQYLSIDDGTLVNVYRELSGLLRSRWRQPPTYLRAQQRQFICADHRYR